jgi:hypothetical protein
MGRGSKITAGLLTLVFGMPLPITGTIYANAWYSRWRAEYPQAASEDDISTITAYVPDSSGNIQMGVY